MPRPRLPAWTLSALLLASAPVHAQTTVGNAHSPAQSSPRYSTEQMVLDAVICRPGGMVATAVGTVLFVVSFPFSALGGNVDQAAEVLVKEPARFTFNRPLGSPECSGGRR